MTKDIILSAMIIYLATAFVSYDLLWAANLGDSDPASRGLILVQYVLLTAVVFMVLQMMRLTKE